MVPDQVGRTLFAQSCEGKAGVAGVWPGCGKGLWRTGGGLGQGACDGSGARAENQFERRSQLLVVIGLLKDRAVGEAVGEAAAAIA